MPPRPSFGTAPSREFWLAALLLTGAIALEWIAILALNGGRLVYTLDDAYIHLTLAGHIAHGHYGVNALEYSAPASSILWPFLLAPIANLPIATWIPLALNILFAIGTLALAWRILSAVGAPAGRGPSVSLVLAGLFVLATNLIGLVFTGMEHSLQVLVVTAILIGLLVELESGRVPKWLGAAIVAAPLIRYEDLVIAAPALLFLAARRHRVAAFASGAAIALLVGGFSWFLIHLGLSPIPASVKAKSAVASSVGHVRPLIANLQQSLLGARGMALAVGVALLVCVAFSRRRSNGERWLAATIALGVLGHLVGGAYGWYSRYEIYIWSTMLLANLYLYRESLSRAWAGEPRGMLATGVAGLLLICPPYLHSLFTTPLASNNIYGQQYQMHRFAVDYLHGPVAVNDIGYVSFGNPDYVLDVYGLASAAAMEAKRAGRGEAWMAEAVRTHGVRLAMIYDKADWVPKAPPEWIKLGELRLERPRITPAVNKVSFYATDFADRDALLRLLQEFQKTLPGGSRFEFAQPL